MSLFRVSFLVLKTLEIEYSQSFLEIVAFSYLVCGEDEPRAFLLAKRVIYANLRFYQDEVFLEEFCDEILRLIRFSDGQIFDKIQSVGIPASLFVCRLVRPLFARELPLGEAVKLFAFCALNPGLLKFVTASMVKLWFRGEEPGDEGDILRILLRNDRYGVVGVSAAEVILGAIELVEGVNVKCFYKKNFGVYNGLIADKYVAKLIKTRQFVYLIDLLQFGLEGSGERFDQAIEFSKKWLEKLEAKRFVYYDLMM